MEKILRKIFEDPELLINQRQKGYTMAARLVEERQEIFEKLLERLSPEEKELLNDYDEKCNEMLHEYEYIAFCSGLRYFTLLFAEIISGC